VAVKKGLAVYAICHVVAKGRILSPIGHTPSKGKSAVKEATLHSLIIAKALLEKASGLCISEDRYLASAGLVVLQDALEIVFYALLIERGVDEKKNIDRISFDELIGELRREGIGVSKSGTPQGAEQATRSHKTLCSGGRTCHSEELF